MARRGEDRYELFRHLKSEELAPIYVVHGEEPFMLDAAVDAIVKAALPDGVNSFNLERFDGREANGQLIREAADTPGLMVRRKVVLLRHAERFAPDEYEALSGYFEDPSPATCLVIHAWTSEKSLDQRRSGVKRLFKAARVFEFKPFREHEVGDFILRQARQHRLNLRDDAVAYLIEAIGCDLQLLTGALEKVDLFVAQDGDRNVGRPEVAAVVAPVRVLGIFSLTDALGRRDLEAALHSSHQLVESGESALRILAMIARHFRFIARLHDPEVAGLSARETAGRIGVSPYFLKDYQRDARRFSKEESRDILVSLARTDWKLKSSRLKDHVILEHLLREICVSSRERMGV